VALYEGHPIDQEDEEDKSTRSDSDDVDDTESSVIPLENGEEGAPTEVVLYEGHPIDQEDEEDKSTPSDGVDVNATEIPIITFKNGVFIPVILTQEQDDSKEGATANENDTPYPSANIKEDGFLP